MQTPGPVLHVSVNEYTQFITGSMHDYHQVRLHVTVYAADTLAMQDVN